MFDKLYSEEVVSKLKKIPLFVWYLFFGLSSAFASLYALYIAGPEYIKVFNELFTEYFANANMKAFIGMVYFLTVVFDVIIFEVIGYFVYSIIVKRFLIEVSMRDFVFRLRMTMIIAYLIIGIISVIYFFLPSIQLITTAILNTSVQNVLLTFFFFEICRKFIASGLAHKAYLYVAKLYLTIAIVFSLVNLFSLFILDENVSVVEYIAFIIRLVVNLATILLVNYHYNKLKSIPPPENMIEQAPEDDIVFKDFDF